MNKWIADFEVESTASLPDGKEKICFAHPMKLYEVHVSNLKVRVGLEKQIISVQLIFEAETIEAAYDISKEHLAGFLNMLCFASSCAFKISRLVQIIDWNPGVDMRTCHHFTVSPDPHVPYPVLVEELFESVSILTANAIPVFIKRALRWYSLGVRALYTDEQFQYFWFALEHIAQHLKPQEDVPDRCQQCGTELFCAKCEAISAHRPFPKQAIEQIIKQRVKGDADKLFDILSKYRNGLLHGEEVDDIQEKVRLPLVKAVDCLGKVVFAAILNSFKAPSPPKPLRLIEVSTYAHHELVGTAVMSMGSSSDDVNNPKIENFRGTKITVEFRDKLPDEPDASA